MLLDPANSRKVAAQTFLYSAIFMSAAIILFVAGTIQRSGASTSADSSAAQCLAHGAKLGVTGTKGDDGLTFHWADLKDAPSVIGQSSAIALSCPGWKVEHFCIGNGCTGKGAEMTLKQGSE